MAIDPVCGMVVNEATAVERSIYKGVTYYFCSEKCRQDFVKQPDDFVRAFNFIEPGPPVPEKPESMFYRCCKTFGAGLRFILSKITGRGLRQ